MIRIYHNHKVCHRVIHLSDFFFKILLFYVFVYLRLVVPDKNDPGVTVSFFPSQFFPRGKNGPAHSFPGEKTDRSVFSPGERFD